MNKLKSYIKLNELTIVEETEDYIVCQAINEMYALHHAVMLQQSGYRTAISAVRPGVIRIRKP